jgi:hypothetical protein
MIISFIMRLRSECEAVYPEAKAEVVLCVLITCVQARESVD